MIRRSAILAIELGLGLSAAALVGAGVLAWRLAQGPIALPPMRAQLERGLSEAREDRPVSIERVDLAWSAETRSLELRAHGVALRDAEGAVLSLAQSVAVGVDPLSLLIGRIAITRAAFVGGELSVVFARDGTARVAMGPPGSEPDFIVPPPPPGETMQARVNRILDGLASALEPVGPGGRLRALSVREAQFTIVDEVREGRITAQTSTLELVRDREVMRLAFSADIDDPAGPAPIGLTIETDEAFSTAAIALTAEGVTPRLLLPPGAMGPLANLDAPTDALITAGLNRETGLTHLDGRISLGRGTATFGGGQFAMTGAEVVGRYNDDDDVLVIERLSLNGAQTEVTGAIQVRDASRLFAAAGEDAAAFSVRFPSARVAVPGVLAEPVTLSDTTLEGELSLAEGYVRLTRARIGVEEATIAASGRIDWTRSAEGGWRPGLQFEGGIEGAIDPRTVLRFWPVSLGEGARSYLDRSLEGGRILNTRFAVDVSPQHWGAPLPDEALDVTFDYEDAQVRFISTMTPLTAGRGQGRLRGNRFDLAVAGGQVGGVTLDAGAVTLPRLSPRGALATIAFSGSGQTRDVLTLLQEEPIGLGERLPVDLATVTGEGRFSVELRRPMLAEVPVEDLLYTVSGSFSGVGARARDRDIVLAAWAASLSGDQSAIRLQGPLTVNGSPVTIDWTESLRDDEATPSRIHLTGRFESAALTAFGIETTDFAQGPLGVEVRALGRGFDIDTGAITVDLADASVTLPGRLWDKAPGVPARATFRVDRAPDGMALSDISLSAEGVAITGGEAVFGADDRLVSSRFQRVRIGEAVDVAVTARRREDQVMAIAITGAAFDAVRYLDGGDDAPRQGPAGPTAPMPAPPVQRYAITLDAARLRMRGEVDLHNATVQAALRDDVLVWLTADALTAGGAPVRLAMGPRASDPSGGVSFSTGDAGVALTALTGAEIVVGGTATASGVWTPGPAMNADFDLTMQDFRVVDVPAMAQLLSTVASLQGLAATLNGEGIVITSLEAPLALRGDALTIGDSRAAGPALGFTGTGLFNMATGEIDMSGVVVPSYGLNSMWGNLPIVGGLLVSREGEGVVGITFTMRGPIDKADIGVNPLSALAPGIFRRIFEPAPRRPAPTTSAARP
jgi:hypothetical protein